MLNKRNQLQIHKLFRLKFIKLNLSAGSIERKLWAIKKDLARDASNSVRIKF